MRVAIADRLLFESDLGLGKTGIFKPGSGGNGRRSPFEFTESVLVGDVRASRAYLGFTVGAGLLCSPSNGSSMWAARSSFATLGLMKRQSSGRTTGVLSVSSSDASKLSSWSMDEPRSKLSSSSSFTDS